MHPTLIHIGNIYLPTFGALAAVGLMCGLLLSERTAPRAGVDAAKLWNAGLFAVIAAFVFSRALLVTQHWQSFREFPILLLAVPSLTAAGLLLTLVATFGWLWLKQVPILRALDAWAPCAALVWASLALGHFAEGSDLGMTTHSGAAHPVALYAAAFALAIAIAAYLWLGRNRPAGETAGLTLLSAGAVQFLLSFIRVPGVASFGQLDLLEWVALAMIALGGTLAIAADRRTITPAS